MSTRLLIVAQHRPAQGEFEYVAKVARPTKDFIVERCTSPQELVNATRSVVMRTRKQIKLLDIFGHGRAGTQFLGDEVLFDKATGHEIAAMLGDFLTCDATVRLLGCETAVGPQGQELLTVVQSKLGKSRTVHGMIASIRSHLAFDASGFMAKREEQFLFSSTEAQDSIAPTQQMRLRALRDWYARAKGP